MLTRLLGVAVAAVALVAPSCAVDWVEATGPVTSIGDGRICVRAAEEDLPGRGCAGYPSPGVVAGIRVGDCVRMRLYAESLEIHDIRKVRCAPP